MLVLGIETATMTGGVALANDERVISEYTLNVQTTHTARLMPALDQILKDSCIFIIIYTFTKCHNPQRRNNSKIWCIRKSAFQRRIKI